MKIVALAWSVLPKRKWMIPSQNTEAATRCSVRKGVLRNLARFTGKHLCQSLFFNKVAEHLWAPVPKIYTIPGFTDIVIPRINNSQDKKNGNSLRGSKNIYIQFNLHMNFWLYKKKRYVPSKNLIATGFFSDIGFYHANCII